jgi:AcrR family transcriptional regulator
LATRRLSREDWIAVARQTLVAAGVEDVKVDLLAHRLRVTRGSFYHHFEHRQALLDALLEDWVSSNRREIAAVHATGADMKHLFRVWIWEDREFPAFDIAVRAWARKAERVARAMREIDDAWVALLQSLFEAKGVAAPESFVRARIMYFHQVGYYALSIDENLAERVALVPHYYAALTGSAAPENLAAWLMRSPGGATARPSAVEPQEGRAGPRTVAARSGSLVPRRRVAQP